MSQWMEHNRPHMLPAQPALSSEHRTKSLLFLSAEGTECI